MRVTELSGDLLDYWVARAEGIEHDLNLRPMKPGNVLVKVWAKEQGFTFYTPYTPSTDIAQAWPIMVRRRVTLQASRAGDWRAFTSDGLQADGIDHRSSDPLVAVIVAECFGDSLPEEIPA
jgi:hypothetical protein